MNVDDVERSVEGLAEIHSLDFQDFASSQVLRVAQHISQQDALKKKKKKDQKLRKSKTTSA